MALKPRLASLDGVDEAVQAHYKEQEDGSFLLDVTPENGYALRDVDKLMRALETERQTAREAGEKLKSFDGLDVRKARDALKQVSDWEKAPPDEKVKQEAEARERELIRAHEEAMKKVTSRSETLEQQLRRIMVHDRARDAIRSEKGNEELLLPHVTSRLRLREQDGAWITEVLNDDGVQKLNDAGEPISVKDLVQDMRNNELYAPAFSGVAGGGGGAAGGGGSGGSGGGTPRTLKRGDPAINDHLDDISTGKIVVVD